MLDTIAKTIKTLEFYRDGFAQQQHRGLQLIYRPTDALLDDCGNRAAAVLREIKDGPASPERKATLRIRRYESNPNAWCIVALDDDGQEIDSYGGYTTALTIDDLLNRAGGLRPDPADLVEIIV